MSIALYQRIFTPLKNPLCSAYLFPELPNLSFIFIVLYFPECCIAGVIQYVALSDCLSSISNMCLRLLHYHVA